MCGIAGFCNFQEDFTCDKVRWSDTLIAMRESIAHRGNDQTGEYLDKNIGFSHTRLSIRDLSGGVQPMHRRVAGMDYIIVYNGEVYNTDELMPGLKRSGYAFETTSDTEVILYAYIEYGLDFVSKLNGIFAFAIWDGKENRLVLYRDRAGVKPLFYTLTNGTLVFGSEIKALFRHPLVTPRVDDDSFREIFGVGPARTPGCGVFQGIREILPGNFGIFTETGFREVAYWTLEAAAHTDSYAETVAMTAYLVRDAITRQMVSDVPVCSFLSGGIDSSIVTAVASSFLQADGHTLDTFSFDFADNHIYFQSNAFQPAQDRPYVDRMLASYPLHHKYLECDETILADMLPAALHAKDLPGMTDIDASLMYFCSIVKEHNKVALTGECADELFGGYPWFYRPELLNADGFPWSFDLSARTVLLKDEVVAAWDLDGYVRQRYAESLKKTPYLDGESVAERRRREVSYLNIRWFMQTLLDRMDRASMSCGLEARVPFADHRLIEYLYNVPWSMKYQNGVEKALLRDACRDLLPQELLLRKKSPYPKIYNPDYEKLLAQRFRQVLSDRDAPVNRLVDRHKAERFLSMPKNYGKPWFGQLMASPQMIAYLLQVNDWMRQYNVG